MFADDFVRISETPEGLQGQIEKASWRVEFKWKWGEEELPIVDRYTYLGVEISRNCSWDADINNVIEGDKAQIGWMHVILGGT